MEQSYEHISHSVYCNSDRTQCAWNNYLVNPSNPSLSILTTSYIECNGGGCIYTKTNTSNGVVSILHTEKTAARRFMSGATPGNIRHAMLLTMFDAAVQKHDEEFKASQMK
jgi:hypothetical protein